MEKGLATITGSVAGFLLGLFLAFAGGLHEPLHVFVSAMVVGGLCGAGLLWLASSCLLRLGGWPRTLVRLMLAAGALGTLFLFLRVIGNG